MGLLSAVKKKPKKGTLAKLIDTQQKEEFKRYKKEQTRQERLKKLREKQEEEKLRYGRVVRKKVKRVKKKRYYGPSLVHPFGKKKRQTKKLSRKMRIKIL